MDIMRKIDQLLNLKIGLDSATVGQSAIHSAVHTRMHELGMANLKDYDFHLKPFQQ